ncbi:MAG: NUDIX hydrolase [Clostridium sp.]
MNYIEEIKRYKPYNIQEEKDKEFILKCINDFDNILTRENIIVHITSSGYIVNKDFTKVLMVFHNIYNSWSWTGGHADGEEDLLKVAIKEAKEETAIKNIKPISKDIFSLDVITVEGHIRRGEYVSSHLHLSVCYLLQGDEKDTLKIKEDENSGVKWIPIEEVDKYSTEEKMIKIYNKFHKKIKSYHIV